MKIGIIALVLIATAVSGQEASPQAERVCKLAFGCHTNDVPTVIAAVSKSETNAVHLVAGLFLWTQRGGDPHLRGDDHYGQHFIYGAAAEVMFGKGDYAARWKEERDQARGGVFNTNQMDAAKEGAAWVRSLP